ncbi:MAG TPA: hypothetical protein VES67_20475 [Vicinamibacterales bacterium]|nr:hypothetical protein [Vicinamibacterales bacterium]
MRSITRLTQVAVVVAASLAFGAGLASPQTDIAVRLVRLPADGIQPEVVVDSGGTAHVVYFSGDPPTASSRAL